jgi:hypothetical protein
MFFGIIRIIVYKIIIARNHHFLWTTNWKRMGVASTICFQTEGAMAMQHQSPRGQTSKRAINEALECNSQCSSRIQELLADESVFRGCTDQVAFETNPQSYQLSLWRDRIAQWYYDVIDHLGVPREIVFLAMNFLDRSVAVDGIGSAVTKDEYELTSTTCLFLAISISSRAELKISELLQLSQSRLQVKDVQANGARLLQRLSLKTPMISPATFAKSYLKHIHASVSSECALALLEAACYLMELSVCDHFFSGIPPSKLAFAAVSLCVTSEQAGPSVGSKTKQSFMDILQDETSLSLESSEIQPILERLLSVYNLSHDGIVLDAPNVIWDDPDDTTICGQDLTESLVGLVPWTPTFSNLRALTQRRPTKRARLH